MKIEIIERLMFALDITQYSNYVSFNSFFILKNILSDNPLIDLQIQFLEKAKI